MKAHWLIHVISLQCTNNYWVQSFSLKWSELYVFPTGKRGKETKEGMVVSSI